MRSGINFFDTANGSGLSRKAIMTEIALARGMPQAQMGLAWVLSKSFVTSPIIGASKPHHLEDAVAALSLRLDETEIRALEELYAPYEVAGFN